MDWTTLGKAFPSAYYSYRLGNFGQNLPQDLLQLDCATWAEPFPVLTTIGLGSFRLNLPHDLLPWDWATLGKIFPQYILPHDLLPWDWSTLGKIFPQYLLPLDCTGNFMSSFPPVPTPVGLASFRQNIPQDFYRWTGQLQARPSPRRTTVGLDFLPLDRVTSPQGITPMDWRFALPRAWVTLPIGRCCGTVGHLIAKFSQDVCPVTPVSTRQSLTSSSLAFHPVKPLVNREVDWGTSG